MNPYYDEAGITIYHGLAEAVLPTLPAESVDSVITSPPYNKGIRFDGKWSGPPSEASKSRRFRDGYETFDDAMPHEEYCRWQREVLAELWRLPRETGAVFYNHKPRIIAGELWLPLALNPGLPLRQIIQWNTGPGVNFMPAAFMPAHEWIMVFAKPGFKLVNRKASRVSDVWSIPPEPSSPDHPCPFPFEIPARIIRATGSRTVLDPFMGRGTTLEAAKVSGIKAIGIDVNERYCEIAANRLRQGILFGAA